MFVAIERFLNKLKVADARSARDIVIATAEAKAIHAELCFLLLRLETLSCQKTTEQPETLEHLSGGSFKKIT